jgi:type VI secretion system Hcp family effector
MPSDAYMEVSPMDIWGESGDQEYGAGTPYGMFEVFNVSFGTRNTGWESEGGASSQDPETRYGTVSINKAIDKSSPDLFRYCCAKTVMDWAIIYIREAGESNKNPWLRLEFRDVIVTSFTWDIDPGGSGDDLNKAEKLDLEFHTMYVKYWHQTPSGEHPEEKHGMWNFADQNGSVTPVT